MKAVVRLILVVAVAYGAWKAFIFYDNNFKYGRMWETPAVRPHEEPLLVMDAGVAPVDGGEEALKAIDAAELRSPFTADDDVVERGATLYGTFCAQCHGRNHDGNGTVGQSFHPLPGDLRSTKVQSMPAGVIFKEISYGIPGGRQPPLASTIAVLDRWRIIAYVKSLGTRP